MHVAYTRCALIKEALPSPTHISGGCHIPPIRPICITPPHTRALLPVSCPSLTVAPTSHVTPIGPLIRPHKPNSPPTLLPLPRPVHCRLPLTLRRTPPPYLLVVCTAPHPPPPLTHTHLSSAYPSKTQLLLCKHTYNPTCLSPPPSPLLLPISPRLSPANPHPTSNPFRSPPPFLLTLFLLSLPHPALTCFECPLPTVCNPPYLFCSRPTPRLPLTISAPRFLFPISFSASSRLSSPPIPTLSSAQWMALLASLLRTPHGL